LFKFIPKYNLISEEHKGYFAISVFRYIPFGVSSVCQNDTPAARDKTLSF